MGEDLIVDVSRGHILQIGEKHYKLYKEDKDDDGRTVIRQVYKEIDLDTYIIEVTNLAHRVREVAPLKLVDIIHDALKDLPLEKIAAIEDALLEAKKPTPKSKPASEPVVRRGGCVELKIGTEFLVLRD